MGRVKDKTVKQQATLKGFVKKPAKKQEESSDVGSDVDACDGPNIPAIDRRSKASPDESSLPPITQISDIFTDIVDRCCDLKNGNLVDVVDRLNGRKLRVATMCSGTESPLLALDMISQALKEKLGDGRTLDVEHVFSCEIEPFKQAYIERNFTPPILFRDVCELGGDEAWVALLLSMTLLTVIS
jgi:hypothetical protein